MGSFVVRLAEGRYVKWSNTVDAPVSPVLDRSALVELLEAEDQLTFSQADQLLTLADDNGTSDPATDLETLLETNRAGPNEESLTVEEILRRYTA